MLMNITHLGQYYISTVQVAFQEVLPEGDTGSDVTGSHVTGSIPDRDLCHRKSHDCNRFPRFNFRLRMRALLQWNPFVVT
jgi:hypothetical protein